MIKTDLINGNYDETNLKTNTITNKLNNNIVAFVICANAFQIAFMSLGIYFDMWIVFGLIAGMYIINKFKFNSLFNIIVLLTVISIFMFSVSLKTNSYSIAYFREFVLYALPIILVFLIKIDFETFTETLNKYSIFGSLLYVIILVSNQEVFSIDYMTFGYNSIFFSSYVFIYSYYMKKRYSLAFALLTIILTFIYGPRGAVLVFGAMIVIIVLFDIDKSFFKKILLFLSTIAISIYGVSFLRFILNKLIFEYGFNNYSIYQFYHMMSAFNLQNLLGSRYGIYSSSIDLIQENVLFGVGIGGFQAINGIFPHNIILDVFVTFGLIFGIFYFAFIYFIGNKTLKKQNNIYIKILFIFFVANASKLLVSKTFVYDSTIWLYIGFCSNAFLSTKKESRKKL